MFAKGIEISCSIEKQLIQSYHLNLQSYVKIFKYIDYRRTNGSQTIGLTNGIGLSERRPAALVKGAATCWTGSKL